MNRILVIAFALSGLTVSAATWTVTSNGDAKTPASGTLRHALANAADGDTIAVDSSLSGGRSI